MIVIVPTIRPEREQTVLAHWHAQTVPHTLLLLRGPGSAGLKRNKGLEVARTAGEEWAVFADDDNYYGPHYLEDFVEHMPRADVISRGLGFVRNGPELWDFSDRRLGFFPGHSTAVRVAIAPDFPDATGGEEIPWSREITAAGLARVVWLRPDCLVYDRSPRPHAYDSTWPEFLRAFGPGVNLGAQPDTYADNPGGVAGELAAASDEAIFQSLEARLFRAQGRR